MRESMKSYKFAVRLADENTFYRLVQVRIKEAEQFEFYRAQLRKFVIFCNEFRHINIDSIRKQLEYLDSLENLDLQISLNTVCQTLEFKTAIAQSFQVDQYEPVVIYFEGVRANLIKVIQRINRLDWRFCVVFKDYFKTASIALLAADNTKYAAPHLDALIEETWKLAYERWRNISIEIESGRIKLVTLNEFTRTYFDDKVDLFRDEFHYINSYFKIRNLDHRNHQIILYNKFKMSYSAALEIDRIHQQLSLIHKFHELDDLLNITTDGFKEWDLNRMDETIERTVIVLDKINDPDKIACLNAFTQSQALVEWLKRNAPSLSELKFLVDLASMGTSSGTDVSMDKAVFAKALKEAGTAFAYLIYKLTVDVTFFEFMGLCEKVCSHLESDRKIADKLLAVKDKVDLLEEIKRKKGNVELTSIETAADINCNGVYRISFSHSAATTTESR
jgi:hypothetical protein